MHNPPIYLANHPLKIAHTHTHPPPTQSPSSFEISFVFMHCKLVIKCYY